LRARQFRSEDFLDFDYLIAMDRSNFIQMAAIKPDEASARLDLMLDYSKQYDQKEVPDPYFGDDGFELVFDMVSEASEGLLRHIREHHQI
jgi:protein-tyrosine phosphatase